MNANYAFATGIIFQDMYNVSHKMRCKQAYVTICGKGYALHDASCQCAQDDFLSIYAKASPHMAQLE